MGNVRALAALFLGGLVSVSGCAGPAEGPLEFDGFNEKVGGQDKPVYFGVPLCGEGEAAAVTIDSVEAVRVTGTDRPIDFRVAWPDRPRPDWVSAGYGAVPAAYVPAEDSAGEVGPCGANRYRYGVLAVVFPPTERKPISVQDLRVTYEVSDRSFTEVVDVLLTQCPEGTRPGTTTYGCTPRLAAR